jgi:hypothetical protein
MDPLVTGSVGDGFYDLTKCAIAGKPFFVGELNQAEGPANIERQAPTRTMLPLAASAYGSLQNWSGLVWFAWLHGDGALNEDGWSVSERRTVSLGDMISDGMMVDHMRTAGIMFRRGLIAKSKEPITISIDEPYTARDYGALMRGKYPYVNGWQDVHAVRKTFGPVPEQQASAPWMSAPPKGPSISDTGEITKDTERKQLTVAAPQAEGFSGFLDDKAPAGLQHLSLQGEGFATVLLVADDSKPLAESASLIISRTALTKGNSETNRPQVQIRGLKKPADGQRWYVRLTRPRIAAALMKEFIGQEYSPLEMAKDGSVSLPMASWSECELSLRK